MTRTPFSTKAGRLEAFSDGVIAVIITVMVLELRPPHGVDFGSLRAILPTASAYALSFVFIGIYWNNHHHMLQATKGVNGRVMWANLYFLFWLSLVPFTTSWLGQNPFAPVPTALYGFVLLMNAIAFTVLQNELKRVNGPNGAFAKAVEAGFKEKASLLIYLSSIGVAFISTVVADVLFVTVAATWIIPDRRFEAVTAQRQAKSVDADRSQ
ncbi:MAG TPA: TMEM175 family protein [Candidatus Baltobacteraceae bacterium]|nr:TMEM175 family protein [Candidatus Baltobacteraceae bacterium]